MSYPDYISEKRIPVDTPNDLVENGEAHFGTFKEPFPNMSMLDVKKPCGKMPGFLKKSRLTVWEAFEINMDEGTLISAVYNMNALGFNILVFYDKAEDKVYSWQNFAPGFKCKVAPTLIDTVTSLKTKNSSLVIENDFANGKCKATGKAVNKKSGEFEFCMEAERVSNPSVVSIPLGKPNPLYSEKDFFKGKGYVKINGKTYKSNENTTCIVDDHKGYYPFHAHYDWLTMMGKVQIDGEYKYLAINFTHNQSISENDYNENLLWLEGESHPIPPVKFEKITKNKWRVYDEHKTVEVIFDMRHDFKMMVHLLVVDISYRLPFGYVKGYVTDTNGKRYLVNGMTGIGEDKTTRI